MLAALLAACGPLTESSERAIAQDELDRAFQSTSSTTPPAIFSPASSSSTTTTTTTIATEALSLFFVQGDRLRPVTRRRTPPNGVNEIIEQLRQQPVDAGYTTLVEATWVVSAQPGDPPRVDLTPAVPQGPPQQAALLVGQIVMSLTQLPGIADVAFFVDGEPWFPPLPDGSEATRNPRRSDYAALVAT